MRYIPQQVCIFMMRLYMSVCMLYFQLAQLRHRLMAAVLEMTCRSIFRASIYAGRRWLFYLWYSIAYGPISAIVNYVKYGLTYTQPLFIAWKKKKKKNWFSNICIGVIFNPQPLFFYFYLYHYNVAFKNWW